MNVLCANILAELVLIPLQIVYHVDLNLKIEIAHLDAPVKMVFSMKRPKDYVSNAQNPALNVQVLQNAYK